ncbi:hypothetical protein ACQKRQ_32295 [Paraburkholderia sp. NPDC080076]|jgi:hypothetical protein
MSVSPVRAGSPLIILVSEEARQYLRRLFGAVVGIISQGME